LVTDTFGNQGISSIITVTVNAAPSVGVTNPVEGVLLPVNTTHTISATAGASTPGTFIAKVEFFANSVSIGSVTAPPASVSFTPSLSWTPAGGGNFALTAVAIDTLGISTTSPAVNVRVGSPPTVVVTPIVGTVGVNVEQTLTATASSPNGFVAKVEFFASGASLGSSTAYPYTVKWKPTSLGTYAITATVTDNVGIQATSAVTAVVVAAISPNAPAVTLIAPPGPVAVRSPQTLNVTAVSNVGVIAQVEFFANGRTIGTRTTFPYSLQWTPDNTGSFTLTAVATDTAGNQGTSPSAVVVVTGTGLPNVSLVNPVAPITIAVNSSQTLSAAAVAAPGSNITQVQFFANGTVIGTKTAYPFNQAWTPTAPGSYALTVVATDSSGNIATAAPVVVLVSSGTPPTVSITNPAAGSSYSVGTLITVAATAADSDGTIASVQFLANGTVLTTATTAPFSYAWTPGSAGTYSLTATATDNSGNITTSAARVITIVPDRAPSVVLTSPVGNLTGSVGAPVVFTATAADVDGTIAGVNFFVNGVKVGTSATAPFVASWTPSTAGSYTVSAEAADNAGNVTRSNSVSVQINANIPPRVSITQPANGSTVRVNSGYSVTAAASDPDGTIASVQLFANGVAVGAALTAPTSTGYTATWTPQSEGVYRLTAVATDNSGASTTTATATTVFVAGATSQISDVVCSGTYSGFGETGHFHLVFLRNRTITFVGSATAAPARTIFFSGVPVDNGGNFTLTDSAGRLLLSGTVSDTGASGMLDGGRLIFIGPSAIATSSQYTPGLYSGNMMGRPTSALTAIVGADGSIALYVVDGTFRDAGFSSLLANGSFTINTLAGSRFSGSVNPTTGFVSGTISGGSTGTFLGGLVAAAGVSDGFLVNVSTRGPASSGERALIAGFVVQGDTPKPVLVRAVGPTLSQLGVSGVLTNPRLDIFRQGTATAISSNDDWGGPAALVDAFSQVGAFALPANSRDAAILTNLAPGVYTAQVTGVGSASGVALVEVYDLDQQQPFAAEKVVNISTRGEVGTGERQLIAGFVVSGSTSKQLLIRAAGPALTKIGLSASAVLANPMLQLRTTSGATVRENDDWSVGNDPLLVQRAAARVGAFPFDAGSRDAAMLISLQPDTYTVLVSGAGTATGIALIEVYEISGN
jgi:hypothetical protein